jgi:decaprenylphospho-beta-D-erythro-pentofuranosid-2-ulose 2-reductase
MDMSLSKKQIIIIGATSAIAEHCARLWVEETAVNLIVVGRQLTKLESIAADLRVRSPESSIKCYQADFMDLAKIGTLVDDLFKKGPPDIVLIAHGVLPHQQQCQKNLALSHEALAINGISPVLFAEEFTGHMEKINSGTLAIIGSVAGDRGRKSNYVYGAAKALVARYTEGLQHRLANTGVKVILIKPGPTDTPMTAHLKQQGVCLAKVEYVAKQIVNGC